MGGAPASKPSYSPRNHALAVRAAAACYWLTHATLGRRKLKAQARRLHVWVL